jgi:hypothetical protein
VVARTLPNKVVVGHKRQTVRADGGDPFACTRGRLPPDRGVRLYNMTVGDRTIRDEEPGQLGLKRIG